MEGWIIYRKSEDMLSSESYEVNRLIETAGKENIKLRVFKPEQFDLIVTRDDRKSILIDGEHVNLPDFLLSRMGAGTTYFALAVIRHLEKLGVYSFNSSESIESVKDKLHTHQILAKSDMPVPKTMLIKFPVNIDLVEKYIGFPVVVKTISGSQGNGVFLSETKDQFADLMQLIKSTKSNTNIILQEFIKSSHGRDLRVFVVGGRVISCMERISSDGNFKANFSRGGKVQKYELNSEIEWLATESSKILNLDISGIDLLFDGEHYKICEANSSPGFEGLESCCDVNISQEIFNFIRVRLGLFLNK